MHNIFQTTNENIMISYLNYIKQTKNTKKNMMMMNYYQNKNKELT